jgi:quinol monooxygenase YgiN
MAFSLWVELEVQQEKLPEFLEAITSNQKATEAEEGCLFFDVVKLEREGNWFGFYEIYRDSDAFFVEHRNYPHYQEWRKAVAKTIVPGSQTLNPGQRAISSKHLIG